MESANAARILADALRNDRLVALVGSGASANATDQGRIYPGLPTPTEFVAAASRKYSYIEQGMSFTETCDAILLNQRRHGLEDALIRTYSIPPSFDIPPAHRILSWLPFSAYVTSNYDQFIERSLERESRHHHVIIENEDVTRLRRGYTPIIKYHGCVSKPSSIVAASGDYLALEDKTQLVQQLIAVSLANRTLLVIGHGLNDLDLSALLNRLLKQLKQYSPMIFVVREVGRAHRIPNFDYSYEVIHEDLTQFLNRVLHEYRQLGAVGDSFFFDEAWVSSAFFAKLRHSFVLPSETQVIDAFLDHLADELGARSTVADVIANAATAVESALQERPNYGALRRTWAALLGPLTAAGSDLGSAEQVVRDHISGRERLKDHFATAGREIVKPDDRILLYSQSQRVLQALEGVPRGVQSRCEIFVAECRPKSPSAYQDAIAIARALSATSYSAVLCPDVVAINLLASGQITKVIMGTHALYLEEEHAPAYAFVNTCGSLAMCIAAERYGIPVFIIGEKLKTEVVATSEADDHLYSHQENDLVEGQLGMTELSTKRGPVEHTNIGYDLVEVTTNTRVLIPDDLASETS